MPCSRAATGALTMLTPSISGDISPASTAAVSGRWLSAAAWPSYSMVTRRITPSRACVSWPAKRAEQAAQLHVRLQPRRILGGDRRPC